MELSSNTIESDIHFTITEDEIYCEYGKLEYYFDEDAAIVNSISVYFKRNGIGTRLVNEFEILAQKNGLKNIEVPASPTKEAILFWNSLGYIPASNEQKYWANKITRSNKETAWDTPQGVIVITKKI